MNIELPDWKQIGLNELPQYSDWPDRMLGEAEWTIPERDLQKVTEEYDKDKYKKLSKFQIDRNITNPKEIKKKQLLGRSWQFASKDQNDPETVVSQNERLYLSPVLEAQWYNDRIISNIFNNNITGNETIIELGAGYGYNLHVLSEQFPDCDFIGGELSENAINLGSKLHNKKDNIRIMKFNYYDDEYSILDSGSDKDIVLFTRLSIEQLPECGSIINRIVNNKDIIDTVVHFEPVYEMYDTDSLLGLLRKRYTEINDYNRDLLSALKQHDEVVIQETEYDIFGDNGLCPMSLIQWSPK